MSRYFIAIDLPAPLREELLGITVGLPGTRWVDEDSLHLTLRFLGDVSGATIRDTVTALARIRMEPFEVQLGGIGFFPPRGEAEVLWLGVDRSAPLEHLRKLVDTCSTRLGIEPDRRRWVPHVTLARLDDAPIGRLQAFAADHALYRPAPFRVESFTLFSSQTLPTGAVYAREQVFVLRA